MSGNGHNQRAPRTPESYFNVTESITLLNIVKSDHIQNAFQSNRKNHSSVWEMVAKMLNSFNNRKRSAKQCCNRYENLKKIYTQLKRNPEKHVRRNWPYMCLFREIEEQRGECWGTNGGKRCNTNRPTESYYQRRKALMLMNNINNNNNNKNNNNNSNLANKIASLKNDENNDDFIQPPDVGELELLDGSGCDDGGYDNNHYNGVNCSFNNFLNVHIKEEPTEHESTNDTTRTDNYNGRTDIFMNGHHDNEQNILHPDVIVDTDHVTDTSSISLCTKRKSSTSTDAESTNYELIEYLKRRERRDEEMFKKMQDREERLVKLLERAVVAIESIASHNKI